MQGSTRLVGVLTLLAASPAAEAAFWDAHPKDGYTVGVHAVVLLGPVEGGHRWGLGVGGGAQLYWHDGPYWSDVPRHVAPLASLDARLSWVHRAVNAELIASAGAMYPLTVGDGGFLPAAGLQGGVGLGLSSDRSAGPIFSANLLAPYSEVRLQVMRWHGDWHAPRLSVGPMLEVNCCSYLM